MYVCVYRWSVFTRQCIECLYMSVEQREGGQEKVKIDKTSQMQYHKNEHLIEYYFQSSVTNHHSHHNHSPGRYVAKSCSMTPPYQHCINTSVWMHGLAMSPPVNVYICKTTPQFCHLVVNVAALGHRQCHLLAVDGSTFPKTG